MNPILKLDAMDYASFVLSAVILTCPVGEKGCSDNVTHYVKVQHMNEAREVVWEEIVCGNRIEIEDDCVRVYPEGGTRAVAVACPGTAFFLPDPPATPTPEPPPAEDPNQETTP